LASATGTGASGTIAANATSAGGIVEKVMGTTMIDAGSSSTANSRAFIGGSAITSGLNTQTGAISEAVGLPSVSFAQTVAPPTSQVSQDLNLTNTAGQPASDLLGAAILAVDDNTSNKPRTYTSTADFVLNLTTLTPQNLALGMELVASQPGTAFGSLHFEVDVDGAGLVIDDFTDYTSATTYFSDHTLDLGPTLAADAQDVHISLTYSGTATDTMFGTELILANAAVPEPASLMIVGIGMLGLLTRRRGGRTGVIPR
jgi:hypothetical protein